MLELMRGGTRIREAIAAHLADTLPDLLERAREEWELEVWELPDVEDYQQYDRNELNVWPAIGINVSSARNFGRVDYEEDTSQVYLTRYSVDMYTWVRTPMDADGNYPAPTYDNTVKLRDDFGVVVRNVLLRTPSLGTDTMQFAEETLVEEYGEVIQSKGNRYVAGIRHTFSVINEESTSIQQTLGDADTIVVDSVSDEFLGG